MTNPAEDHVIARAQIGAWADLDKCPDKQIPAPFIRALLLGLPPEGHEKPIPLPAPGLRITGATITGSLDLTDCTAPSGGPLPGLSLENCVFHQDMDLSNAHLTKLSLKGSFINGVTMRGIQLQAGFDCSDTRAQTKNGPAWIDAHAAKIHGFVTANGAKLQAQTRADGKKREDWQDAHYALRLSDALIEGSLDFMNNFSATGGITIGGARITGDIRGRNATLTAGEQHAFSAQSAQIGGSAVLNNLTATGCLWMLNITISGTLSMPNAHLQKHKKDSNGVALEATNATIGGSVLLRDNFTADGQVSLSNAKINGGLDCNNGHFANHTADGNGLALNAVNTTIGGDVFLRNNFTAEGQVSLSGAKINGDLDCYNGHFANRTANGNGVALSAEGTTIGGSVLLTDNFTAVGQVSLLNAKINGSLECNTATIYNDTATGRATTLNATNAEIGQDILLARFTSIGSASFWGCRTGGNFNCTNATFAAWGPGEWSYALDGRNLTIGQDADLSGTRIIGRLVLEHAQIGGALTWGKGGYFGNHLEFPTFVRAYLPETKDGELQPSEALWGYSGKLQKPEDAKPPADEPDRRQAHLILAHAKIGAGLQAYHLIAEVPLIIDLSAAQAYTLDDDFSQGDNDKPAFPAGWGGENTKLDLDGFTYQRIEHFPVAPEKPFGFLQKCLVLLAKLFRTLAKLWPHAKQKENIHNWCKDVEKPRDIATPRLDWLKRQHKKPKQEDAFYPQPYRHLATVLRNQGHREAARKIAIAEGNASARGLFAPFYKASWGYLFGFGLAPLRAFAVMFLTIIIGWGMVKWADHNHVLILTPDRVEAYPIEHPGETTILKCGPSEIWPSFYALDMAIPLIPLHQEDRCEIEPKPGTWAWQLLWAFYSIIAKIITSLALITFSGVMKPKDE